MQSTVEPSWLETLSALTLLCICDINTALGFVETVTILVPSDGVIGVIEPY